MLCLNKYRYATTSVFAQLSEHQRQELSILDLEKSPLPGISLVAHVHNSDTVMFCTQQNYPENYKPYIRNDF